VLPNTGKGYLRSKRLALTAMVADIATQRSLERRLGPRALISSPTCRTGGMRATAGRVCHDRHLSFFKLARQQALTAVDDGDRKPKLLKPCSGLHWVMGDNRLLTCSFEGDLAVEREKRLIFYYQDHAPTEINPSCVHVLNLSPACVSAVKPSPGLVALRHYK
jgi:hypothetical protein